MSKLLKKYQNILFFILCFILTIVCYKDLPRLFYTNDEFLQYGMLQIKGISEGLWDRYSLWDMMLGRGRPMGTLLNNIFFYNFPYSAWPFAVFSYVMHPLNSFLVYLIVKKVSKQTFLAVIAGIFFTVSSVAYQTFSWMAATVQVVASTTFVLTTIWSYIVWCESKKKVWLIVSFFCIYMAFLFKDSSLFILLFLPFIPFAVTKTYNLKSWAKTYWPLFIGVIAFGLYRLTLFLNVATTHRGSIFTPALLSRYLLYGFNIIFFPLVSLGHFFLPYRFLYKFSYAFGDFLYPFLAYPNYTSVKAVIEENIISDMVACALAVIIIAFLTVVWNAKKHWRKTIVFFTVLYGISMIPTAIYLDHRNTSYIESRYLYFSTVSVAVFFAVIVGWAKDLIVTKGLVVRKCAGGAVCLLGIMFLVKQISVVQREMYDSVIKGNEIKGVLQSLTQIMPKVPNNPVIFLDGNTTYYFYPHIKVPLQVGPGYMFLLTLFEQGRVSPKLFEAAYTLWQIRAQGYRSVGGEGFGYFFDKDALVEEFLSDPSLSLDQLSGLYYDGSSGTFRDTTGEIKAYVISRINNR